MNNIINRQEYIERLRELERLDDTEAEHALADDILVEILIKLGMDDIADAYGSVNKWYA